MKYSAVLVMALGMVVVSVVLNVALRGSTGDGRREYLALTRIEIEGRGAEKLKEVNLNFRRGANPKDLTAGLNALGSDGWTLVGIEPPLEPVPAEASQVAHRHGATYVFRRPESGREGDE